jgi:hypothetical protein
MSIEGAPGFPGRLFSFHKNLILNVLTNKKDASSRTDSTDRSHDPFAGFGTPLSLNEISPQKATSLCETREPAAVMRRLRQ